MFTIRVYGLWIRNGRVLLSSERVKGFQARKFPGGGLEFGEGTVECLIREFREELGLSIRVLQHVYTTDFFVPSFLDSSQQVISIYYQVEPLEIFAENFPEFPVQPENNQSFIWEKIDEIETDSMSFPIDKVVLGKLQTGSYKPV